MNFTGEIIQYFYSLVWISQNVTVPLEVTNSEKDFPRSAIISLKSNSSKSIKPSDSSWTTNDNDILNT